ncbi:MAG: ABC transporter ATP-binding protein [Planctomycetes bacterium]|nr:ABC transporter ATP-binding protein [Planctomycetota bacterium]
MNALISMKGITRYFLEGEARFAVLKDISVNIEEGEYSAIIGQSGSGKSTLLNILGCLDNHFEGNYALKGEEVSTMDDAQVSGLRNRLIGFVFQSFNLIPQLTLSENVEVPLYYLGIDRKERQARSLEFLEKMKIDHRKNFFPTQISGGEKQRCAIARALASHPSLILADEPTGNLDSKTGKEIMNIFDDLSSQGKTIIMVTHDNEIANRLPRVIRIKDGVIES